MTDEELFVMAEEEKRRVEQLATRQRVWTCKIGFADASLLDAVDGPDASLRKAVADAYRRLTGKDPAFCFSGWGGHLDPLERAIVEEEGL